MRLGYFPLFLLIASVLGVCVLPDRALGAEPVQASPGKARFVVRTDPSWDAFTALPDDTRKMWFRDYVWRMMVYSPYFDSRLAWYPNAWIYINLYSIPVNSVVVKQHPDWVLRDAHGQRLYIPYECRGGSCPQYAADVSNPAYRQAWLEKAAGFKRKGYKGFWIDDVNLAFRVSDGNGDFQAPVVGGKAMTEADWSGNVVTFLEQIRSAFPDTEILHNAIWFSGGEQRDKNPLVQRQLRACDYVNVERGVTDSGLKGGDGEWSLNALLSYIDRVHQLGKGVVLDNTGDDYSYGLAGFYLISSGADALGSHRLRPDQWPSSLGTDLGAPLGKRHEWKGLLVREFSGGVVLLNPPGRTRRQVTLSSGPLHNADSPLGQEIQLSSPGGVVLSGTFAGRSSLEKMIHVQ